MASPIPGVSGARFQLYEYAYYLLILYGMFATPLGLTIPMFGVVGMFVLAGLCVLRSDARTPSARKLLFWPILSVVSFIAIQMLVHGEPLGHTYIRPLVVWILVLVVVRSLSARPGFIRRFSTFACLVGLGMLPFINFSFAGTDRAGLDSSTGVGMANPNDLAAWFGFCALAFVVRGFESRRVLGKWVCLAIAIACLLVVGWTVSRAPMAAFAVAAVVALRSRLKRGFLPVLLLVVLVGGALVAGVFDRVIEQYSERGMEDTGRMTVWPLIIDRVVASPWVGVGVTDIATPVRGGTRLITPHNGVLFFALGAGVLPMLFFVGYWIRAFWGAWRGRHAANDDAPYLLPLLVYAFLVMMVLNQAFTHHWATVSAVICLRHLQVVYGRRQRQSKAAPVYAARGGQAFATGGETRYRVREGFRP